MARPTGDDIEFDEAASAKDKPKSKSKSKVADKKDDTSQDDTVIEKDQPKPRFHPRYLTEAHRLGIPPGEIEACANNSELRELVEYERRAVAEEQRSQAAAAQQRQTRADSGGAAPKPHLNQNQDQVDDEEDWKFEDDEVEEMLDPKIKKELKRLGKATKLSKADRELMKTLQEQLEEARAEIAAMKANSDPKVQLAISTFAKYPALFGDGRPADGTPEAIRQKMTMDYIFGAMKASGEFTGDPAKDIPKAVAVLFPAHTQAAAPPAAKDKSSRVDQWNDSAQLTPTNRNGADRTGKPGGRGAAARKVAEKRRELGLIPDDFDDDIDFDDDDDDDI